MPVVVAPLPILALPCNLSTVRKISFNALLTFSILVIFLLRVAIEAPLLLRQEALSAS